MQARPSADRSSVAIMARLPFDDYLRHLETDSARLRTALARCDPAAQVPNCPDWTAADLLGHHSGVLHFWAGVVEQRPAAPAEETEPDKPTAYDALLAFHEEQ